MVDGALNADYDQIDSDDVVHSRGMMRIKIPAMKATIGWNADGAAYQFSVW
jgi:hypothetical protein